MSNAEAQPISEPGRRRFSDEVRVVSARPRIGRRISEIWRYRELLAGLIRRELKVKYKDSVLGFAWTLLNPALKLVVYWTVFEKVLGNGIPSFAIFFLSGLLVWNFFSEALGAAAGSVVGNSAVIKKVSFPREILPLAAVGASLVNFFLQSIVLVIALALFRHAPSWEHLPLLIPALLVIVLLAAALGILLAAMNVPFRDTQHLLDLLMMLWFWMTPIVYQFRLVADRLDDMTWVYMLNPVTSVVTTFQRAVYGSTEPLNAAGQMVPVLPNEPATWYLTNLGVVGLVSLVLLGVALVVFGRLQGNFAEEL